MMWKFFWYGDPKGPDLWRVWYDSQDGSVKGHEIVFDVLETRTNWTEPFAKKLDDGLVEIIIKTKVQHRLLGFNWPHRMNFTVLLPCNHKGTNYKPRDALETAAKRMKEIKDGKNWIRACVRPS